MTDDDITRDDYDQFAELAAEIGPCSDSEKVEMEIMVSKAAKEAVEERAGVRAGRLVERWIERLAAGEKWDDIHADPYKGIDPSEGDTDA